jgi:predicted transcriptional regulator
MKLNDRRKQILSTIASSPRNAKHFTHGNLERITSPVIVEKWLAEMAEAGYLYEQNGVYSITQKGRQAIDVTGETEARPVTWKGSVYVTGQGETGFYQRPGSDHSHIPSFGLKC